MRSHLSFIRYVPKYVMFLALIVNGNLKKIYLWLLLCDKNAVISWIVLYSESHLLVLTLHVDKHNTWTYLFCLFISDSCTSHSPTYWLCLTELRGALSNCTFSDLEVRCLPCGCLWCLLLRYFLMSVCELIFNKSPLLCGFFMWVFACADIPIGMTELPSESYLFRPPL